MQKSKHRPTGFVDSSLENIWITSEVILWTPHFKLREVLHCLLSSHEAYNVDFWRKFKV